MFFSHRVLLHWSKRGFWPKRGFFFCLCATLALALMPVPARAETIDIAGKVLNKTTNSPIVGAEVQLVRPDGQEGGGEVLAKTRSGNGGAFSFPAQQVADDDLLVGRVRWQDYPYETPLYDGAERLAQFNLNVDPHNSTIAVYNGTTEPPDLQFMVHHIAIASTDKGLKCTERIVVENPSNETFIGIGPRQTSILLDIPRGARDVKLAPPSTGAQLVKTGDGYGIAKPITPSSYNQRNAVVVEYLMDWQGTWPWQRKIDLSQKIGYPTFSFFVMRETPDQDLKVEAPKLSQDTLAPVPIDGQQEQRIINSINPANGGDHALEPGDDLKITVTRPVPAMFWGFLGLLGCLLLFLPLALIGARRRDEAGAEFADEDELNATDAGAGASVDSWEPAAAPSVIAGTPAASVAPSAADEQRVRIMANDIARLDEAHELGQVEDEEYQLLRADKKNALIRLLAG